MTPPFASRLPSHPKTVTRAAPAAVAGQTAFSLPQLRLIGVLMLATAFAALAPAAFAQTSAPPPSAPTEQTSTAPSSATPPAAAPTAAPTAAETPTPKPADATAPPPKPAEPATSDQSMAEASADLADADGKAMGTATIMDTASGMMHVMLELKGLPAGVMAVHIHQTGKCEAPKFESAGGHLTGGHEHGVMAAAGIHEGDIPNLHVPENGALTVEAFLPEAEVADVTDSDGGAIIIHTKPDDYMTQPSGDAGDRLACGVFSASK